MAPNLQKELRAIREEAERQDPNYVKNLLGQLRRDTCWEDGDEV